ncbi:sugar phosphate nucleotidyltransferase [Paenibacillus gansuensis]|uniref:Sugar phosphate nucleotidyltransferase n=1 Tax=Paenibacillus gansuensis TaxID=306542 RepID=A0ABW5P7K7_9BACL
MKIILLSGGSGSRLWPLSNDARSKQFLKVLETPEGETVSMVQRVWEQIRSCGFEGEAVVATSSTQVEILRSQLGEEVPLIVEPERRDTFPAIALASTYLYSAQSVSLDEIVVVLPVDPYVENEFFHKLKELESAIRQTEAELALMGVYPTYPSTKYGYIVPEEDDGSAYRKVKKFAEKPDDLTARLLMEMNAYWNCGVFAFRLGFMIDTLIAKQVPVQYDELLKQYGSLPKISFDYEVVEKAEQITVIPYSGYWKDLGTWNTLTEEMSSDTLGDDVCSHECRNTHVLNELDIPITVIGLDDVVVAASPDGILVSAKSESHKVKELMKVKQAPRYEEKKWGWIRILDSNTYDGGYSVVTKRIGIHADSHLGYRMHTMVDEVWTVVQGEGEFIYNGNRMHLAPGNVVHIPKKTLHGVKASGDMEIIVVQTGHGQESDETIELYDGWQTQAAN